MHWSGDSCYFPLVPDDVVEMWYGIVAGDGFIQDTSKNVSLIVDMTNHRFLKWLDEILGWVSKGTWVKITSEQQAEGNRKCGFHEGAVAENYNDLWGLRTITHPRFSEFRSFYSGGEKSIPGDFPVTRRVLKFWYVSDGGLCWDKRDEGVNMTIVNKQYDVERVFDIFREAGFDLTRSGINYTLGRAETRRFLDWLGDPVPGFEYKFEASDIDEYKEKKADTYST